MSEASPPQDESNTKEYSIEQIGILIDTREKIFTLLEKFQKISGNDIQDVIKECAQKLNRSDKNIITIILNSIDNSQRPLTIYQPGVYIKDGIYYSIYTIRYIHINYLITTVLGDLFNHLNHKLKLFVNIKTVYNNDGFPIEMTYFTPIMTYNIENARRYEHPSLDDAIKKIRSRPGFLYPNIQCIL